MALVAVALAGCGSHADPQRAAVVRYVSRAAQLERELAAPLQVVSRVSVQAASSARAGSSARRTHGSTAPAGASPAQIRAREHRLGSALAQIESLGARLRTLPAPTTAARLRSLLLALMAGETRLTGQVRLLIAFLPGFAAATAPLGTQLLSLERALSVGGAHGAAALSASYRAKAEALRRFVGATNAILARVRSLVPPAASRPEYAAELSSLRGMNAAAARLAARLRQPVPGDVRSLLIAFDRAAVATRSLHVQLAQRAAIRAYDRQVQQLSTLASEIASERDRLASGSK